MATFIDVIKNWGDFTPSYDLAPRVSALSYTGREGVRTGSMLEAGAGFSAAGLDEPGLRRVGITNQQARRMYMRDLGIVAEALKRSQHGDAWATLAVKEAFHGGGPLREALSVSDFPNLFGDIIDRAILSNYRETPYSWNMYTKAASVNDFRPVKRFAVDYGTGRLSKVEMLTEYPESMLADRLLGEYNLAKFGRRMPFAWETMVNDDLNGLKDTPARFGRAVRRSEEYFVTSLFANNTTFFNSGNNNIVVPIAPYTATNPALTITALAQAMVIMAQQRDLDNEPIDIEAVTLVVPPALKVTAQNILNADYFFANDQGGTVQTFGTDGIYNAQQLHVANWAKNIVRLAVNYYLPIVDASHGNTGWYLFANAESGRPAIEFGRLRGHETPELFMKSPNAIRIGEGSMGPGSGPGVGNSLINPMEGDFDTDSIHYKVRHVFGGTLLDPKMAVYSNGSGS